MIFAGIGKFLSGFYDKRTYFLYYLLLDSTKKEKLLIRLLYPQKKWITFAKDKS